ncbi:MAG: (Fe-S)-binding protein [Mariniphaga sp.]|nr:(Fe-S)-binding protein [Mariniphaga sp.]
MEVSLFIPCFIDQIYPDTAHNIVKILEKCGCKVFYNPEQTCCDQPSFNSGFWDETRELAKKFITDFNDDRIIVGPSASCVGFVRNYYEKLFDDQREKQEVLKLKTRIFEFNDFLVNHLNIEDLGATFPFKVTFHDACAALREYGVKEEPRKLLKKVKGLELIEMEDTETCCGFGGTFATKFKDISTAMTEQKVSNAIKTGAEFIVSTEASCLLNINSYIRKQNLPIKTIHIADVLASGY